MKFLNNILFDSHWLTAHFTLQLKISKLSFYLGWSVRRAAFHGRPGPDHLPLQHPGGGQHGQASAGGLSFAISRSLFFFQKGDIFCLLKNLVLCKISFNQFLCAECFEWNSLSNFNLAWLFSSGVILLKVALFNS